MIGKVRIVYVACALLAIASGSFAVNETAVTKDGNKGADQQTPLATSQNLATTNSTNEKSATTTPQPLTTKQESNSSTPTTTTIKTSTTTDHPTTPTKPAEPTTVVTTVKPTAVPTITSTTAQPTKPSSSIAPSVSTTAVPPTTVAPPNKERHFDGLSFLGGITLATCLMAIGAVTWKFYRTCNERNYRTL